MPQPARPTIPEGEFDIRAHGAVEGGETMNSGAIRETIRAASLAGGGRVVIPPGKWLTGAIQLDNNIELHLARGAELLFSQRPTDYLPVVFSRHEDTECYKYSSFIYADGKTNIAITGEGVLNGQGKPWWEWKESKGDIEKKLHEMGAQGVPVGERVFDGTGGNELRPAFFQPMRCRNVLVEGVTFLYGAFWTITPTYCENVIVRNVRIETEGSYGHTPNGDGIDPSSCKNVLIEHCVFDTGDDCVAIKAGRDQDGLRVNIPTENVVIRHCAGVRGHGGIVIGSETSGGIRNIYAYDCAFRGTDRMVRLKTARRRGGIIENAWFSLITGEDIQLEAIHLNMLYTGQRLPRQPVTELTPRIRNIHLSQITLRSGKSRALELVGIPEMPLQNITFDSLSLTAARGIGCDDARGIRFSHVCVNPDAGPLLALNNCQDVLCNFLCVPPGADPILSVAGDLTSRIAIRNTRTADARTILVRGPEVPADAVLIDNN